MIGLRISNKLRIVVTNELCYLSPLNGIERSRGGIAEIRNCLLHVRHIPHPSKLPGAVEEVVCEGAQEVFTIAGHDAAVHEARRRRLHRITLILEILQSCSQLSS